MKSVYWRPKKISATATLGIGLFAVALLAVVELAPRFTGSQFLKEQQMATDIATQCREHVLALRKSQGLSVNQLFDPHRTGVVGTAMSPITSKPANLESKQISLHPQFPAAVVQMLVEAGVSQGDTVAIGWTGSFPGLNISLAAAVEALDLQPVIIASVTASQYGANEPKLTWLDMESSLRGAGLLRSQSLAATVGGPADCGVGMGEKAHKLVREATSRNNVPLINAGRLSKSIDTRMELQTQNQSHIAAYINVGGGVASSGGTDSIFNSGVTSKLPSEPGPDCVMQRFSEQGTPVINLAYPQSLAKKFGLSQSPDAWQTASLTNKTLASRSKPNRIAALLCLAVICGVLRSCVLSDLGSRTWTYVKGLLRGKPALRAVGQEDGPQLMA